MSLLKNIHTLRFDTMDSTHTWCKKNRHTFDAQALTCVSAGEQTAGYGRHGRTWVSLKDLNIAATLSFTLPLHSANIGNLGQVLSLSAASVLSSYGYDAEIKWPNDVRIAGKKIAGVLCDTQIAQEHVEITLSIGLNVNMPSELLERIDQPATSLYEISGHLWDVREVLDHIVKQFAADLAMLSTEGFLPFHAEYTRRLAFKGKEIRCNSLYRNNLKNWNFDKEDPQNLHSERGTIAEWQGPSENANCEGNPTQSKTDSSSCFGIQGICQGILPDGRLVLAMPNGEKLLLSAGDIH